MSEVALYRKYRPKDFREVMGQEHIVATLEKSIKNGKIFHAYLFAGSRGTGKTSVARIFAKDVGCTDIDLYEIDAASNRGIDEIRAIREAVHTLPYESPYKVYIFDEAHMLTKEAWNALLKTLEEPPKHTIFILATTELEKVPETVVSRCQTFVFKKPSHATLRETILRIAQAEGYTLDTASADLIALLGDGSFRDTTGILQKILSASSEKRISLDEVEKIAGAPKEKYFDEVLSAIEKGDPAKALESIEKASNDSDMGVFLKLLVEKVRVILLLRFSKHLEEEYKEMLSEHEYKFLLGIAHRHPSRINSKLLEELLLALEMSGRGSSGSLALELAILKILHEEHEEKV